MADEALGAMMERDAEEPVDLARRGVRGGADIAGAHASKIGFHGGKVEFERPRVRDLEGQELVLPIWQQAVEAEWLGKWAMNLMQINVPTRKFRPAVQVPQGHILAAAGANVSKSAASRHFVALWAARRE
jgi:hypothetical protein